MHTTLISLDPQNPQPGQQWSDTYDDGDQIVYTLVGFNEQTGRWNLTEEKTYANGTRVTYSTSIHPAALAQQQNVTIVSTLTDQDRAHIDNDLGWERDAARIDAAPVAPMSGTDTQTCLDCGYTWRGTDAACPRCGESHDIIDAVEDGAPRTYPTFVAARLAGTADPAMQMIGEFVIVRLEDGTYDYLPLGQPIPPDAAPTLRSWWNPNRQEWTVVTKAGA